MNPSLSPGGRRLIGKIGIGLFSVSQLTRHFQIITKGGVIIESQRGRKVVSGKNIAGMFDWVDFRKPF